MAYIELSDGVWIGPQPSTERLAQLCIEHCISLRRTPPDKVCDTTMHHRPLPYWEAGFETRRISEVVDLVTNIHSSGQSLLVHCFNGIDRSGVFGIAYCATTASNLSAGRAAYNSRVARAPGFGAFERLDEWAASLGIAR